MEGASGEAAEEGPGAPDISSYFKPALSPILVPSSRLLSSHAPSAFKQMCVGPQPFGACEELGPKLRPRDSTYTSW